ncbi:hypothetical protein QJQ45_021057 [Haematococcus lacustris]|nr:hypothetical protein QJQ45_021057 [Haematococcus lacustris]
MEKHGEAWRSMEKQDQQQEEEQQQEEQQQWSRAGGKQSRDWSERKRVEDQHWTALNKCMRRSYISNAPQMEECYSHKRMQSSLQSSVDAAWSSHACCGVAGSCQQESLQPRDSLPAEYVNMNYRSKQPSGYRGRSSACQACHTLPGLHSQQRDQPVRGTMWSPVVAPRKPQQASRSSQEATQPAASEPGPSIPPPAKRSKRTKAEQAAEPTQPTKGKGKGKGKAAKAKPAPQPGRWLDRDCNAALNMQRIGENRWRLCWLPSHNSACITSITADSAAVNMGEYGGVVTRMSKLLQSKGQAGCIRAQPCYSHGIHNTLLAGLAALGGDIRPAIESIASLLAQYWVPLGMGAWGAKPQVPCDTRWASYISSTVTMLRVWAHARDAVSQLLERQKGMSPPWAVTLSQLLQDNSLLLRLGVVAVVGESFLVPELMWASKDDGLHAFELYRHTQDVLARLGTWDTLPLLAGLHSQLQHLVPVDQREQQKQQLATYLQEHCAAMWTYYQHHVQAQMALPHLFAALGSSDQATRMEVAIDVVYHAELRLPPPEDGQQQQQQQQRMQQQQQQEDPYGSKRKRKAPAANKSRAAKQAIWMAHLRLRSGATLLAGVVDAINRGVSFGSVCSLLKTQGVAALADPATGELHARVFHRRPAQWLLLAPLSLARLGSTACPVLPIPPSKPSIRRKARSPSCKSRSKATQGANYANRISTVENFAVVVSLLCAKELSDTQRKHDGHCPHRARLDSPPCPSRGASGKEPEASPSFSVKAILACLEAMHSLIVHRCAVEDGVRRATPFPWQSECLECLGMYAQDDVFTPKTEVYRWKLARRDSASADWCWACCSECSTVHEQQQQQQAVVYEQQCKDSSSSGWAAVAGCRCVAAAGCRCVAVQVAAGCRCASVHEQQQQQAGVHVLQCMSSSSRM